MVLLIKLYVDLYKLSFVFFYVIWLKYFYKYFGLYQYFNKCLKYFLNYIIFRKRKQKNNFIVLLLKFVI